MHTLKIGILKDMFNQLQKYVIVDKANINKWEFTKGVFKGEEGYELSDFKGEIKTGDRHYPTYDSAHFFKANIRVPKSMDGKKLRAKLAVGGEALIKCNGRYVGGCTSRVYMPDRADVHLGTAKAGQTLKFEIEATVDSMSFCNEHLSGAEYQECYFGDTYLFTVDEETEGYLFDIEVAFDALSQIKDEHIYSRIYSAIDDSLHLIDYDFEPEKVRASVHKARKLFADRINSIKWQPQSRVILTGHSHIDVAWLWRIQESIRKSARTFTNVTSLMDMYPEMTFGQSQAVLYDMTKRHYPDIYKKIKEKVAANQWDICGNVWVEADTNIASGESLIRQVLYGTEFFKKEFGKVSKTYWLPDCFGFTAALPQIIKGCGMENFITSKLSNNDTTKFPYSMFLWKGNNGDIINAHLMRPSYNCNFKADEIMCADNECNNKNELNTSMSMYGYGDGGGGPTRQMLERSRRLKHYPGLPETEIGHVDDFFKTYHGHEDELPVWTGEMYYENHRGTFTSQAFVKKNNRRCEYKLTRAELLSVLCKEFFGSEYPKDELEDCWKILMTNQFHDILPGSSIHEVFEDCKKSYRDLNERLNKILYDRIGKLNASFGSGRNTVTVWNLSPARSSEAVEISDAPKNMYIDGQPSINKNGKLVFAPDIEPFSYKTFRLTKENTSQEMSGNVRSMENSKIRIKLDKNGFLTSVYDKVNNREALSGKGNILSVSLDKCIHETAWNLELNYKKKMQILDKPEKIELIEDNSLRKIIRVVKKYNKSTITQDYILYYNSDSLIFDTSVDWHESDKVLKAGFDVAVTDTDAYYDIAHGAIKRPTHYNTAYDLTRYEVAAHKWADLSEGGYGCSIINDCKYGYDIHDSHMRITLMRAPTCPDPTGDHGINTFRYELHPHKDDWRYDTVGKSYSFNIPPVGFFNKGKSEDFKTEEQFISLSEKNITLEAMKLSQSKDGIIVRFSEEEQRRGRCRVTLPIKFKKVIECNMIEEEKNTVSVKDRSFSFDYKPYEVKTFKLLR
ncbi:MAG: hypothetical protein K6F64_09520 [Clostridia bacterium]|nr:hypothetical protein [Clostridia bacterium]